MKIISWNVNGYRAVWKKNVFDWVNEFKPDVLCVQETKAWEEQLTKEQINPHGYTGCFSKAEKKGYSGVATFGLKPYTKGATGFGVTDLDSEGRLLVTNHDGINIANIYFPNGKQNKTRLEYKMRFYEATLKYFKEMTDSGEKVVVLGDYNTAHKPIDLTHPKNNAKISGFLPMEREWIDRWIDAGFVDSFRKFNTEPENYTWWDMRTRARDRNIGWRIDYLFVSENMIDQVSSAWINSGVMGSDHCPLGIEVKV
jgi:exodeoxyribonuclease-3